MIEADEQNNSLVAVRSPLLPLLDEDFVCINVCGMKYETLKVTLENYPHTLLGSCEKRELYYVKSKSAYFFDRNRESFEAILYYYQSGGMLIRPPNIPMHLFTEEIKFFDLGEDALTKLQENEGYIQTEFELPTLYWQRKVWELFEYPDSSFAARMMASWSLSIIAISIIVFCMETMPQFNVEERKKATRKRNEESDGPDEYTQPWFSLELGCIIWFTIEYLTRLLSCPNKWKFLKSFLNIIDLFAILPYFITMSIDSGDTTPLSVLRVVRLVRVFRIFKLSRHSLGLQILGHTLRASISELGMLIFFLFLGVILFSSAIYYAEQPSTGGNSTNVEEQTFRSIPDAFWYSLVTMTTVGYGDKVPTTTPGKVIGTLCAVCGVLTIALPVPVIVSNFEFYNKRDRNANRVKNEKKLLEKREKENKKLLLDEEKELMNGTHGTPDNDGNSNKV